MCNSAHIVLYDELLKKCLLTDMTVADFIM